MDSLEMADPSESLNFGPFVIVQAAVAAAIGLGIAASWLRGEKSKGRASSSPNGVSLFFDGPFVKALDILQGMYREFCEMRAENKETVAEFRERHEKELDLLREIAEAARISGKRDSNAEARRRRKGTR